MTRVSDTAAHSGPPQQPFGHIAPCALTEAEAWVLWEKCIKAIALAKQEKKVPGLIRVRHMPAELITLYGRTGRLERFWLRTLAFNRLVIVGNRDGLLPLEVGSIHG